MQYCPYCMQPASEDPFCSNCGKPIEYTPKEHQLPPEKILEAGKENAYLLGAALGQGGFGITYVALEKSVNRRVAVKEYFPVQCCQRVENGQVIPKPGMDSVFQGGRKSFLEEARMLSRQKSISSVVEVMDYFEKNGTAYLVMEFLDGTTLQHKIMEEGAMQPEKLMDKLPKLLADMDKLHRSGIIHRDISPDNVMWMPDDTLKLLDFGCARSMEDGKSMTVQLKHGFAPVEQYMTRGQGPWTDVYALSATVYYCLTGKVPPMAPERLENDKILSPSALGIRMDPEQETTLMWGLTVQPKARPVSMEVFKTRMFETGKIVEPATEKTAMENRMNTGYNENIVPVNTSYEQMRQNTPEENTLVPIPPSPSPQKKLGMVIAAAVALIVVIILRMILSL